MSKEQLYSTLDENWNKLTDSKEEVMAVDYEYDDALYVTGSIVKPSKKTFLEFAKEVDVFVIDTQSPAFPTKDDEHCDCIISEIMQNFELGQEVKAKFQFIDSNTENSATALYEVERCIPRYDEKAAILVCKFVKYLTVPKSEKGGDYGVGSVSGFWKSFFDQPFANGFTFPNFNVDFEKAIADFESNVGKFVDGKIQDADTNSFAMMISRGKDGVTKVLKSKNGEKPTVEMFDKNGDKIPCALNEGNKPDDEGSITTPSTDAKPSAARSAIEKFKKILG